MKHSKKDRVECTCGEIYSNSIFLSQHINDELEKENKALKESRDEFLIDLGSIMYRLRQAIQALKEKDEIQKST